MNVGTDFQKQAFHVGFLKDDDVVNKRNCRQDLSPFAFWHERPPRPLELPDRLVTVECYNQSIARTACALKISNMTDMQEVEAAICKSNNFSFAFEFFHQGPKCLQ